MERDRRRLLALAGLSAMLPPGAAAVTLQALYAQHLLAYRGVCGPHAPDIPARPCSFAEYAGNDFVGSVFGAFGLTLVTVMAALVTAAAVALCWLSALAWRLAQGRGPALAAAVAVLALAAAGDCAEPALVGKQTPARLGFDPAAWHPLAGLLGAAGG